MRKFFHLLITTLLVASIFSIQDIAFADDDSGIDAILILDVSGSMNNSDPERLSISAAKMLVDKLDKENDNVAVIAFSSTIINVTHGLIGPLKTGNIMEVHEDLDRLDFTNDYTDSGLAFKRAAEIFASDTFKNSSRKPMVIFLADGKDNPSDRNLEDCKKDVNDAVSIFEETGCPVYTIGLNYDGTMDQETLYEIAQVTGGEHYEAASSNDIPIILSNILANHRDEKINTHKDFEIGMEWTPISFTAQDSYVSKIDITIVTKDVVDCEIYDPEGQLTDFNDSSLLYYNRTNKYTVIQLFKPQKGNWTLKVKKAQNVKVKDVVHISFIHSYELTPKLFLSDTSANTTGEVYYGEPFTLAAQLEYQGQPVDDIDVYKNVEKITLFIQSTDPDNPQINTVAMVQNGNRYEYTGSAAFIQDYKYWCEVDHTNFIRQSEPIIIKTVTAPVPTAVPTNTPEVKQVSSRREFPLWAILSIAGLVLLGLVIAICMKISGGYFFKRKKISKFNLIFTCSIKGIGTSFIFNVHNLRNINFNYIKILHLLREYSYKANQEDPDNISSKAFVSKLVRKQRKELNKIYIIPSGPNQIQFDNKSKLTISSSDYSLGSTIALVTDDLNSYIKITGIDLEIYIENKSESNGGY